VINELEWIWNEVAMARFEVLSLHLLRRLRKTIKNLSQVRSLGKDLKQGPSKYKAGMLSL
jgi:hypothetical protein